MKLLHEENVQKFYSRGSAARALQEEGFLSFGYWGKDTRDYFQAAEDLLDQVIGQEEPMGRGAVLNVACGYGAETFRIFDKLQPEKIIAIDLTQEHVEFARKAAAERRLAERILFRQMDACRLEFEPGTFAYAIAIEGPAHFKSREAFLKKVYEVLEPDGVLLLSDIIVNNDKVRENWFNRCLSRLCAKHWLMPKANWTGLGELEKMLDAIGFERKVVRSVGDRVYPGFARFNIKWSSVVNAMRTRGIRLGVGLTFISWLLGFLYRRGILDYTIIRATKSEAGRGRAPRPSIIT